MVAKWSGILSTTEPRNDIGILNVRQGNKNSELAEFQIIENNKPYDLTGLTVLFCASFGLNQVEKTASVVNAKEGKISYTFDDDAMQQVGRQKGYFSIKKAEAMIDSTQEFEYRIQSSIFTRLIDAKSHIFKLNELMQLLEDFVTNSQTNFSTWFDSVKEILYGVDPGGNILRELIEARNGILGKVFPSLKARLDTFEQETNSQLAHVTSQTNGYISLSIFCERGGIVDNTVTFKQAIAFAKENKKGIYIDGIFLTKENIIIEDNTIPFIFGDGTEKSILIMDLKGGTAIENQTYYSRALKFKDLTVRLKDNSYTVSGIKCTTPSIWGSGIIMDNVHVDNFTETLLDLEESFNESFVNCKFTGGLRNGVKVAKILKFSKKTNFGSSGSFKNCVFHFGKIGVQNIGGTGYNFDTCTFESLTLFHHISQAPGLTMMEEFSNCWFEEIGKGIINSDIDESTLLPLLPISNKAPIERIIFRGNIASSNVASPFLNSSVEPKKYNDFSIGSGYQPGYKKIPNGGNYSYNNGLDAGTEDVRLISQNFDITDLAFTPYNALKLGVVVVSIEAIGYSGNKMNAVFISSNYKTDGVLQGTVTDSASIGYDFKLQLKWTDNLNMNVLAYAKGLIEIKAKVTFLLND